MGFTYFDKARSFGTNTGTGTNAGVTVATTAAAGVAYVCTSVDVSGDAAALVTIESPAGTVIWRKRFAAAFNMFSEFAPGVLKGAPGDLIQVKVSTSTSNCEANISWIKV